jgi:hypothetical protein
MLFLLDSVVVFPPGVPCRKGVDHGAGASDDLNR